MTASHLIRRVPRTGSHRALGAVAVILLPVMTVFATAVTVPTIDRIGLAAAVASASTITAVASPRGSRWHAAVFWSAASLAVAVQVRLDALDSLRAMLLIGATALVTTTTILITRWARFALPPRCYLPLAGVTLLAMFTLRAAPFLVGGGGQSGRLPVGPLGTVQIGEFTRNGVIVAVAFAIVAISRRGHSDGSWRRGRPATRAWTALSALMTAAYLLVSLGDLGPLLITLIAVGAVVIGGIRRATIPAVVLIALTAAGVLVVVAVLLLTSAGVWDAVAARVASRITALDQATGQIAMAKAAAVEGGAVGSGVGSSSLAPLIPVADSDFVVAVLAADLGMLVAGTVVIILLLCLANLVNRLIPRTEATGLAARGVAAAMGFQLTWATLGPLGVVPMTGINAPWLVGTGSALLSAGLATGLVLGAVGASGLERTPTSRAAVHGARPFSGPGAGLMYLSIVVAIAVVVALMAPWPRGALPEARDRGAILTRSGVVLATGDGPRAGDAAGSRIYPRGAEFADVTGRSWGLLGHTGLEASEADVLACGGSVPWWEWAEGLLHPVPCRTADVATTIDDGWQDAARAALSDRRGAAVALDAFTGEVLSIFSTTAPDPSDFTPDQLDDTTLLASADPIAPGSVIKPFVAAVAIEAGVSVNGPADTLVVDGESLYNAAGGVCHDVSIEGALEQSCNSVFGSLGVALGADRLAEGLRRFFDADAPLDLDLGRVSGLETGLSGAQTRPQVMRAAIGQESMRATPLAIAAATARIVSAAQGQAAALPHVVTGTCEDGVLHPAASKSTPGPMLSASTAQRVLAGMERAVDGQFGTMQLLSDAESDGTIAGKSGTAEVPPEASASELAYWAVVILDARYVVVVQVRDESAGHNAATEVARTLVRSLDGRPGDMGCWSSQDGGGR